MTKSNKAAKSVIIMVIFSLASKVLGFIREVLIASKFGAGMETDTYLIAIAASGLFTTLIATVVNTTLIPVLSEIEAREGKAEKIKHINNFLNISFLLAIILVIVGWIGAPILVKLLASGFVGEQYDLAVYLTRIGMPVLLFSLIHPILRSFLQSEMMFTETAASAFPYNIVYIFFLVFLSTKFGIVGLVVTNIVAVGSQILLQIFGLRKSGYKYKFIFKLKNKYVKKVLFLTVPILIGTAINEINVIIDKTLASGLVKGSISALTYSNRLTGLILGVFITAITTVVYPMLSEQSQQDNVEGMKEVMRSGVNSILLITLPATAGLIVLAKPIIEVVFQRGEFDAQATILTTEALVAFSIGLVGVGLRPMIGRVFYSLQDTRTPMINGAIAVSLNIILNLILVRYMQHAGLALATSISGIVAAVLLMYSLQKKIGSLGTKGYIVILIKSGLASVIMGVIAHFTYNWIYEILGVSTLNNFISLGVSIGLAIIIYGILCYMFNIKEVRDMVVKFRDRISRKR